MSEHNHTMKSIEEILESVLKSYRKHAHLLIKHLVRKAVTDRISWNEHGIMTIDNNVVKDLNIHEYPLNKRCNAREKNYESSE